MSVDRTWRTSPTRWFASASDPKRISFEPFFPEFTENSCGGFREGKACVPWIINTQGSSFHRQRDQGRSKSCREPDLMNLLPGLIIEIDDLGVWSPIKEGFDAGFHVTNQFPRTLYF